MARGVLLFSVAGAHMALACAPQSASGGRVSAVGPDLTLSLGDGRRLVLSGIDTPVQLPALAEALETLVGRTVRVTEDAPVDRYGRIGGPVFVARSGGEPDRSLQHRFLESGLVRHRPDMALSPCGETWARIEAEARLDLRGLWAPVHAMVLPADPKLIPPDRLSGYEVVVGRVFSVGETRRRLYLNFGRFWGQDFTVTMTRSVVDAFQALGEDPRSWAGREVLVRGFLEPVDGALIAVTEPAQIALTGSGTF